MLLLIDHLGWTYHHTANKTTQYLVTGLDHTMDGDISSSYSISHRNQRTICLPHFDFLIPHFTPDLKGMSVPEAGMHLFKSTWRRDFRGLTLVARSMKTSWLYVVVDYDALEDLVRR